MACWSGGFIARMGATSVLAAWLLLACLSCSKGSDTGHGIPDGGRTLDDDAGRALTCEAGTRRCDGNAVLVCRADGSEAPTGRVCDGSLGETCFEGACVDACAKAAADHSYLGCEYWPTTTPNSVLQYDFTFAVAVANPNDAPVDVRVYRGSLDAAHETVPPHEVVTIPLDWVLDLSSSPVGNRESVVVRDGAYRLTSSLPVTVYQFSPLEYEDAAHTASFSNDASLLLPTAALGNEYRGIAWSTHMLAPDRATVDRPDSIGAPGFLTIVATDDGTTVHVRSKAKTLAGASGTGVPALSPGEETTVRLDRGDVLELLSNLHIGADAECTFTRDGGGCTGGRVNDLTGSAITSDKPIAVFGGHYCTHIPESWLFCDHLEEQLTPLATWGRSATAVSTKPLVPTETNFFRVVSGGDGNVISFEPEVHAPITLDDGEIVTIEHQGALRVEGTQRLQLVQYMVSGEHSSTWPTSGRLANGDPSMGLVAPMDQFRNEYTFLAPRTFRESFVTVIAPLAFPPVLDDAGEVSLEPIDGSELGYAHVTIADGAHHMRGPRAFGITVYGVAPACSYLYIGGLDLVPLVF